MAENHKKIKEFTKKSQRKLSLIEAKKVQYPEMENELYQSIVDQSKSGLAVSTHDIIDKP